MKSVVASSSRKSILLVDDDRLVLSSIASGLSEAGYGVATAESAEDAEAWLAGGDRPDLVVLDIRMPGQSGLNLAQRLRELDHIPFMILSAYSDAQYVDQATALGALGYAVKPIDINQLVPAIEAAQARADEIQDLRRTRAQLQRALDAERSISVATGITMTEYNLSRAEAFALLRDTARKRRRKLFELADDVVDAREQLCVAKVPTSIEAALFAAPLLDISKSSG